MLRNALKLNLLSNALRKRNILSTAKIEISVDIKSGKICYMLYYESNKLSCDCFTWS